MMFVLCFLKSQVFRIASLFLGCEFLLRLYLMMISHSGQMDLWNVIKVLSIGFISDIVTLSFFLLPKAIYIFFMSFFKKRPILDKALRYSFLGIFIFILLFSFMAEILFWEEFTARFNFIAVDYLVYTHEVFNNIKESYNLPVLLSGIFVCFSLILILLYLREKKRPVQNVPSFKYRSLASFIIILFALLSYTSSPGNLVGLLDSQIHRELSQNGIYSLFSAFFQNSLSYDQFYMTQQDLRGKHITLKKSLSLSATQAKPTLSHPNVIFVVMESMSAEFMGAFGNKENLTPNMDKLSKESLFLTNLYATGSRTVRGIEAVVLAYPPSPGQSIVKRPENENLNSIGFAFKKKGYETAFVYGGNAYFDNMGYFFSQNGYDVIDRKFFSDKEVEFENAWGICDEDLYKKVVSEADKKFRENNKFSMVVLTTSNHRPYTYPDGRIDLPSKISGRAGGVKYADYAVGKFIENAKTKRWFDNTIFIFVADHTHGTAGRLEINPEKYHIPCIIYAPKLIKPKIIDTLCSQIDISKTVLEMIGVPFNNEFALNFLHEKPNRAFISNFQKLGYLEKGEVLTVLKPKKEFTIYHDKSPVTQESLYHQSLATAVHFYEKTSNWKENLKIRT